MISILSKLSGGDRKSIGRAEEVAEEVIADPRLVEILLSGIFDPDTIIRSRSSVALRFVAVKAPELIQPHKETILAKMPRVDQWEVREQFCILLPCLELKETEIETTRKILMGFLDYYSSIVRTCAMQALVDLTVMQPRLLYEVKPLIENLTLTGTAAMRARGRKLLRVFERLNKQ